LQKRRKDAPKKEGEEERFAAYPKGKRPQLIGENSRPQKIGPKSWKEGFERGGQGVPAFWGEKSPFQKKRKEN